MGKKPAAAAKAAEKKAKEAVVETSTKAVKAKKKTLEAKAGDRASKSCKVKACKRGYRAKGYCVAHYRQWRHGKFGIARYKTCKSSECRKPIGLNRHGYCEEHFQSYYVKGVEEAKPVAAASPAAKEEKAAAAG